MLGRLRIGEEGHILRHCLQRRQLLRLSVWSHVHQNPSVKWSTLKRKNLLPAEEGNKFAVDPLTEGGSSKLCPMKVFKSP